MKCQYCGKPTEKSRTCSECEQGWPHAACRCENNGDYCESCAAYVESREALRSRFYVIYVYGDVEPSLHGPFATEEERDAKARLLREEDSGFMRDGIYPAEITNGELSVDSYSGAFFEKGGDS